MMNQISTDLGIPLRFGLNSTRSSRILAFDFEGEAVIPDTQTDHDLAFQGN
jgi:hypothetical protein